MALGSGGARGYAHVGVIKALLKHNIPIGYVSGTSMGSIVGAYYALNLNVDGLEKIFCSFKKTDILKYIDLNDPRISLVKGNKLKELLKKLLGDKEFKDTKIPLSIGATTIEDGTIVNFRSGKIIDAILASSAIPGVFPPVKYHNKNLVDGGLANLTPVSLVRKLGAKAVVGVDVFGKLKKEEYNKQNVNITMLRSFEILFSQISRFNAGNYKKNVLVLYPEVSEGMNLFAIHEAKKYIAAGEKEAEKNIEKIKRLTRWI